MQKVDRGSELGFEEVCVENCLKKVVIFWAAAVWKTGLGFVSTFGAGGGSLGLGPCPPAPIWAPFGPLWVAFPFRKVSQQPDP